MSPSSRVSPQVEQEHVHGRRRRMTRDRLRSELRKKAGQRRKRCGERVVKYCRRGLKMYKNIFAEVFSWKCLVLTFYSLRQLAKMSRTIPLAKRVTWRHLTLEPLCCLDSMPIRNGCFTAACFQLLAICAVTCAAGVKIGASFQSPSTQALTDPLTFVEITNHPVAYCLLVLFNILWLSTVIMLLIGVTNFNPHLMRPHICVQVISVWVCALVSLCMSIQLALGPADNARNGPVEEVVTLISCILVILVQWWSISVVHECMEFFQLCQVLLDLAKGRRRMGEHGLMVSTISDKVDVV